MKEEVSKTIKEIIGKYWNGELDETTNLMDNQLDSVTLVKILDEIDLVYPDVLDITDMFQYVTLDELINHVVESLE